MNNGRPLGNKKAVQLLVIILILAWATQTLLRQWGAGDNAAISRAGVFLSAPVGSSPTGSTLRQVVNQLP